MVLYNILLKEEPKSQEHRPGEDPVIVRASKEHGTGSGRDQ